MDSCPLPLEGVRIVEIGQLIAVPSAGQQLLEYGADVLKVEPLTGEQARNVPAAYGTAIVQSFNRDKTSVPLDLRSPDGAERLRSLIRDADAVIHNMRPGALDALGFSFADMQAIRPDIISVSVSGFGPHGPSARRAGLDIAAQAESGLMSVTGEADGEPQRVGSPIIDHATGYIVTQTVLAALIRRDRFGYGTQVRVPLLEVAVNLQSSNWVEQQVTGAPFTRTGNGQPSAAPAADHVRAADGSFVVSGYNPTAWKVLCELIDRPDMVDDPRFVDNPARVANRTALVGILDEHFQQMTTAQAVRRLTEAGIVAAEVRTYEDVHEAEDIVANSVFIHAQRENGSSFRVPAAPHHSQPTMTRNGLRVTALDREGACPLHA